MANPLRSTSSIRTILLTALLVGATLAAVPAVQAVAPTLDDAVFEDSDADGFLDQVRITFNEAMDDSTIRPGDFAVTFSGEPAIVPHLFDTGATPDDAEIILRFFERSVPDTAATPELTYTQGTAKDAEGESLGDVAEGAVAETDGAPPVLMGASAQDTGTDDTIVLSFSEDVRPAEGTGSIENADFCYVNGPGTSNDETFHAFTGPVVDGRIVTLTMSGGLEAGDIGSAKIFPGTGTASDCSDAAESLEDSAGNHVIPSGSATVDVPKIVEAQVDIGFDRIRVKFNMAVADDTGTGDLAAANFAVSLDGGSPAVQDVEHTAGSSIAIINLDGPIAASDVGGANTVAADTSGNEIAAHGDSANLAAGDTVTTSDSRKPRVTGLATVDVDGDGRLDAVKVTFDENIDDSGSTFAAGPWSLSVGDTAVTVTAVVTGGTATGCVGSYTPDTADDNVIFLCFDQSADIATDGRFAVSYDDAHADAAIVDLSTVANPLGTLQGQLTADTAPPTILSATTLDADSDGKIDGYTVTFSEPVLDSSFTASEWSVGGTASTGFDTGDTVDDAILIVQFAEGASADTDALPELTYTPGSTLTDLAGNALAAVAAGGLTEADGAPPVLLSAVGDVGDTDITLTFSEGVRGSGTGDVMVGGDLTYSDESGSGASGLAGTSPVSHTADAATATVTLNQALVAGDIGTDTIAATSAVTDAAGNTAVTTAVTLAVPADETAPAAITDLASEGVGSNGQSVTLSWTAPGDDGSTGTVASYTVKRHTSAITTESTWNSATTVPSGSLSFSPSTLAAAGSTQEVTVSGLSADTTYHFAVKGVDDAGNAGAVSNSVEVTTDVTAPGAVTDLDSDDDAATPDSVRLTWTAPSDTDLDRYELRRSDAAITASNVADADAVASGDLTFDPATLAIDDAQAVTVSGLAADTDYYFAVRAVDENGNRGAWAFTGTVSTAADATPPTGTLDITSSTHSSPATSQDPAFSWSAATDGESAITYRYALTRSSSHTFGTTDETTPQTSVTLEDVGIGTFTFHLRAESAGGNGPTDSLVIHIRPTEGLDTLNAELQATLQVDRDGGDAVLTWDVDAVEPKPVGIQIWRSTSPFAVIATVTEGDAAYDNETYTDEDAPDGAAYIITAFYGDHEELGKFATAAALSDVPGYEGLSEAEAREQATIVPAADDGLPTWLWVLIIVIVVLVVAGIVVAIILATRKKEEEPEEAPPAQGWAAEEWEDEDEWAMGEETHHMTCPKCDHDFTASGIKPLTTTCPNCHVKGVLR